MERKPTYEELEQEVKKLEKELFEYKRVEMELRESEAKYHELYDNTPDMYVSVCAKTATILNCNQTVHKVLGYPQGEIIGRPIFDMYTPDSAEYAKANLFPMFKMTGTIDGEELQLQRKDGSVLDVALSVSAIRDKNGNITHSRSIWRDITERKQFEMDAQQHREELAHLVRVATMGELSAAMAHELNQPLTAILSNAQAAQRFLAGDTPDLDEVRDILTDIVVEDKRAGEIIHRLGLLMKKEKAQIEFLNINEVIREATNLVCSDLAILNVSMSMDLNEKLPPVKIDRIQLQQVILNFILNSSEAMKDKDPESRHLKIITRKDESDTIIVSVKDSGGGIKKDNFGKVFEPFYSTKSGGLGMGLPINKRIIEAHHGRLWAENNPDGGVTFSFTLPIGNGGKP